MKKILTACIVALCITNTTMATKIIKLRIVQTSDVHGSFFPYDFVNRKSATGSMARVMTYVDFLREHYGENLILLDNGDILQGQPICYYSNYVNTKATNIAAGVLNYMGYNAVNIGNHDIETGHSVYDKWIGELKCPVLGANIVKTSDGTPYVKPYTIIEREGVKIAVLGMLTPAIPNWLKEKLWSGLKFEEMVASSKKWVDYIKSHEHPDIIIGLFHSGKDGGITTPEYEENAAIKVAKEVDGFDLVLFGHDHTPYQNTIKNNFGHDVVCLDPSCNAQMVSDISITLTIDEVVIDGKIVHRPFSKSITGEVKSIDDQAVNTAFLEHFQPCIDELNHFVNKEIGSFETAISTRDCYFGSAAFTDFIHDMQLKLTGADISFNAPLAFDAHIDTGRVVVGDLFNLYKYENQVYTLKMTGKEIRNYLEMSYDLWTNTMTSPDDHILLLDKSTKEDKPRYGFRNFSFNFDSAVGIDYEVDVTKPNGQKVKILRMSDGKPFEENKWYKVAMNSYRGNGGGELLTRGAGISHEDIKNRIIYESERDQRYYLMQEIESAKMVKPMAHNNWKFIPEKWTKRAIAIDRKLLFSE